MIFHTLTIDQTGHKCEHTTYYHLNQNICGLQYAGCRPQTVTLSSQELLYILQNKQRGYNIAAAMAPPQCEPAKKE